MGATLLNIVVTLALQSPHPDSSLNTSTAHGIAFERLSDLLQYNRVQGLSVGFGYQVAVTNPPPATLYGTVRYGFSDERVTGRLTAVRIGPTERIAVGVYHDIADLDPFSPGRTYANTLNALFAGHDNGDYALTRGASVSFERSMRAGMDLVLSAQVERSSSTGRVAQSAVNDFLGGTGHFPPNPPVDEGTYAKLSAQTRRVGRTRWTLTADVLAGSGQATARLFGDLLRSFGNGTGATVRVKAGAASRPAPPQSSFRLGGLNTVRGFEYATRRAPTFWAGQLDVTPFGGRVRPVIFLDAGQAADIGDLLSSTVLVGGGVGLSLFSGLIRFDLSRPISRSHAGKVRFDLIIQGAR